MRNSGATTGTQGRPIFEESWSKCSTLIWQQRTLSRRFSSFHGTISCRSATCFGMTPISAGSMAMSPQATSAPSCRPSA